MSDWTLSPLGDLVEFRKGTKADVFDQEMPGTAPYLGAAAIDTGQASQYATTRGAVVASPSDVLMLWDGERSGLVGDGLSGVVASTVCRLRPLSGVDSRFLRMSLRRHFGWIQGQRTGTGVPHVPKDLGSLLRIALPPESEQRGIAEVICAVEQSIESSRNLLNKSMLIMDGLADSLLRQGNHVGNKVVAPEGWTVAPLSEITSGLITYGIVQAGPHVPGGVPYIRTGDMSGDDLQRGGMLCTTDRIARRYSRSMVRTGDLVCAIRATVGKVLPVPSDLDGANLTQGTARIAAGPRVDGRYLLWEMRGRRAQQQIALAVKGTTFAEITLAALRRVQIAFPSMEVQREIAAVLDSQDRRVRIERDRLTALSELRDGLSDDLLSGRIRVPVGVGK